MFSDNPAATQGRDIVIYNLAFQPGSPPLDRVLGHELGHVYWNSTTDTQKKDFEIAANWLEDPKTGKSKAGRAPDKYVESDGMDSPTEDFANDVEYLLFDPKKLKTLTPSLFSWLRSFLGVKFELGGECANSSPKRTR